MAIKIGKKLREESTKERIFKKEEEMLLSVMSSGIKIRKAAREKMNVAVGDGIWFAYDSDTNKLYLYKVSGNGGSVSKVSNNSTFHNKGLEAHALVLAGLQTMEILNKGTEDEEIKFSPVEGKEFKTGDVIDLNVSETPTEGIYFELTFKELLTSGEDSPKETKPTETTETENNLSKPYVTEENVDAVQEEAQEGEDNEDNEDDL